MKKLIVWLLVLCMSLCLTAIAEEGGNFSDEMKFDDGCDLSPEDGADSVERLGDHPDSPYFSHLDFYHMTSTDTLTILTNFKTIQQSSEWSCGVASALMTLEWYGLRGDYTLIAGQPGADEQGNRQHHTLPADRQHKGADRLACGLEGAGRDHHDGLSLIHI